MGIQTAVEHKQRGFGFGSLIWVSTPWYSVSPTFTFCLTGYFYAYLHMYPPQSIPLPPWLLQLEVCIMEGASSGTAHSQAKDEHSV